MEKIGMLKHRSSREISGSKLSVGFECLDRKLFDPEKCYGKVGGLGVKFARCQTGWNRCEVRKGEYDFAWLDDVVDKLLAQGVQPWFNAGFGNRLYMPSAPHESAVGHVPLYYGDEAVSAWRNYLKALAGHFKDRIRHFEIWNEPNLKGFWAPLPEGKTSDPAAYAELLRISSECIRAVAPGTLIIACTSFVPLKYIRDILEAGAGDHIDILALHPYGQESTGNYVRDVRNLLDQYTQGIKIWQGERGAASAPGGHDDPNQKSDNAGEEEQARSLLRRTVMDLTTEYELTSYFHMTDLMENPYRQSSGEVLRQPLFGLLKGLSYSPKKSYFAYGNLCAVFDDDTVRDALPFSVVYRDGNSEDKLVNALIQTGTFRRKGYPLLAYQLVTLPEAGKALSGTVRVVTLSDKDKPITEPVVVDLLEGTVYAADFADMLWWQSQIYPGDCLLENLPLHDYPLLVTDRKAVDIV